MILLSAHSGRAHLGLAEGDEGGGWEGRFAGGADPQGMRKRFAVAQKGAQISVTRGVVAELSQRRGNACHRHCRNPCCPVQPQGAVTALSASPAGGES